jgi:hypothetical protein
MAKEKGDVVYIVKSGHVADSKKVKTFTTEKDAFDYLTNKFGVKVSRKKMNYEDGGMMKKGGWVKNSKGNYRKQTKAEIKNDVKFKAKKAGWKKSEATGDWYYEDRPNRTDKSRTLRYASGGFVKNSKGNYRKQTKAELAHDSRFKAKKAGWKQSEATGDWYYEDRPNRTDKSRKLKV